MNAGAAAIVRAPAADLEQARRREAAIWAIVALAVLAALASLAVGVHPLPVLTLFAAPLALVAAQRVLLAWSTLLGLILVVILFIPIRRYTVGGGMPIELEPYRVIIALVLGCWLLALLADPDVRWRKTGLEPPIVTFGCAILLSLVMNVAPRQRGQRHRDQAAHVLRELLPDHVLRRERHQVAGAARPHAAARSSSAARWSRWPR